MADLKVKVFLLTVFKITDQPIYTKAFLNLVIASKYVCVYVSLCFIIECYSSIPSCEAEGYLILARYYD